MNTRLTFLVLETAATEIDDLDGTLRRVTKKNILQSKISSCRGDRSARTYLGFEIAVDNAMVTHQREGLQHLACEPSNETGCEAMEVVRLDQLVEVDAQELHRNAQMATEVEVLGHLDDVVLLVRILLKVSAPSIIRERLQEHDAPISGDYPRS